MSHDVRRPDKTLNWPQYQTRPDIGRQDKRLLDQYWYYTCSIPPVTTTTIEDKSGLSLGFWVLGLRFGFGLRYKARQDKTCNKTRRDKTRQDKTRQDKTRQDKTRQDKTR